jgi:hypothetical protein
MVHRRSAEALARRFARAQALRPVPQAVARRRPSWDVLEWPATRNEGLHEFCVKLGIRLRHVLLLEKHLFPNVRAIAPIASKDYAAQNVAGRFLDASSVVPEQVSELRAVSPVYHNSDAKSIDKSSEDYAVQSVACRFPDALSVVPEQVPVLRAVSSVHHNSDAKSVDSECCLPFPRCLECRPRTGTRFACCFLCIP